MSTRETIRRSLFWPALLVSLFVLAGCGASEPTQEWAQWRGDDRNGISTATNLPIAWAAGSQNIRWKTEIPGIGNSSPIAKNGRVFLTFGHRRDNRDVNSQPAHLNPWRSVIAIDLASGKVLWTRDLFQAEAESTHRTNTLAAPTPIADESGVYVFFGSMVAKLEQASGKTLWEREVDPTYAQFSHYGAASSPALSKESLIVLRDGEKAGDIDVGWLTALDRQTGAVRWRKDQLGFCCTYTSPVIVNRGAGEEILVAHSGALVSTSARTGERLWASAYVINQMVGTPVVKGDLVGISGGAHNVKNNVFLQLEGAGAKTTVTELWSDLSGAPQNASPLLLGNLYFTVTDQGVLTSRDAKTGKVHYRERIGQRNNRSSLLAAEGKLYVQSSSGSVVVVEAAAEYKQLARNSLGERGSNASPGVAGNCLLIRTKIHLHCIDGSIPFDPEIGEPSSGESTAAEP